MRERGHLRHGEYAQLLQVSLTTATRDLNWLVEVGKLRRDGNGKNTYYEVAD